MKVNIKEVGVRIDEIRIGECFLCERTKDKNEMGVYMRIDDRSGVVNNVKTKCYAVNLSTGQLRPFDCFKLVTPIRTEVNVM